MNGRERLTSVHGADRNSRRKAVTPRDGFALTTAIALITIYRWKTTMIEKLLYGTRRGKPDYTEEIITTDPAKFDDAKRWALAQGFDRFRTADIDLSKKPDFTKIFQGRGKR